MSFKTVYILLRNVAYEGYEIYGVYRDRDSALEEVEHLTQRLCESQDDVTYNVKEYEVLEGVL